MLLAERRDDLRGDHAEIMVVAGTDLIPLQRVRELALADERRINLRREGDVRLDAAVLG